jgi:hypothetical protein
MRVHRIETEIGRLEGLYYKADFSTKAARSISITILAPFVALSRRKRPSRVEQQRANRFSPRRVRRQYL